MSWSSAFSSCLYEINFETFTAFAMHSSQDTQRYRAPCTAFRIHVGKELINYFSFLPHVVDMGTDQLVIMTNSLFIDFVFLPFFSWGGDETIFFPFHSTHNVKNENDVVLGPLSHDQIVCKKWSINNLIRTWTCGSSRSHTYVHDVRTHTYFTNMLFNVLVPSVCRNPSILILSLESTENRSKNR